MGRGLTAALGSRRAWSSVLALACVAVACSKGRPLTAAGLERPPEVEWQKSKRESPVHIELRRLAYKLENDGTYTRTLEQRYRILQYGERVGRCRRFGLRQGVQAVRLVEIADSLRRYRIR